MRSTAVFALACLFYCITIHAKPIDLDDKVDDAKEDSDEYSNEDKTEVDTKTSEKKDEVEKKNDEAEDETTSNESEESKDIEEDKSKNDAASESDDKDVEKEAAEETSQQEVEESDTVDQDAKKDEVPEEEKPSQGQKRECTHGYCGGGYGFGGYGNGHAPDTGYHGYTNGVNGDYGHERHDCSNGIGCYNQNYGHGGNLNDGCHGENCHHDHGHHNHDRGFEVYEEWGEERGHGEHQHEHGIDGNHHGYELCGDRGGQGYYGYAPCHGHEGFHGHDGEHGSRGHHHGFQHEWGHDDGAHAVNNGEFANRGNYFERFGRSLTKIKSDSDDKNYNKKWTTNGGAGFTEGYRNEYAFGRPTGLVSGPALRLGGTKGFLGGVDSYGIQGTHEFHPRLHNYNEGLGYGYGNGQHYNQKHGRFGQGYSLPNLYKYGYGYGLGNEHIPYSNTHQINGGLHFRLPYVYGHKHHGEHGEPIGMSNHINMLPGVRYQGPRGNWNPVHNLGHATGI